MFVIYLLLRSVYIYSVYAIGDCIQGPMLAHKAEDEGSTNNKLSPHII